MQRLVTEDSLSGLIKGFGTAKGNGQIADNVASTLMNHCKPCSNKALLLQGTCRNDVCVCTPGYSGTYCEVPPACGVINDINGNCCKNGIVSQAGTCCGSVSSSTMLCVVSGEPSSPSCASLSKACPSLCLLHELLQTNTA